MITPIGITSQFQLGPVPTRGAAAERHKRAGFRPLIVRSRQASALIEISRRNLTPRAFVPAQRRSYVPAGALMARARWDRAVVASCGTPGAA
jgi:hypothetical protein